MSFWGFLSIVCFLFSIFIQVLDINKKLDRIEKNSQKDIRL